MSVLIRGIKVHRGRCWECPCLDGEYGDCNALEKDVHDIEDEECPLIELPDHGDLIDRDDVENAALMIWVHNSNGADAMEQTIEHIRHNIAAVIPAERSE